MLVRTWRDWNSHKQLVGMETVAATVENGLVFPQIVKQSYMTQQFHSDVYTPKN